LEDLGDQEGEVPSVRSFARELEFLGWKQDLLQKEFRYLWDSQEVDQFQLLGGVDSVLLWVYRPVDPPVLVPFWVQVLPDGTRLSPVTPLLVGFVKRFVQILHLIYIYWFLFLLVRGWYFRA